MSTSLSLDQQERQAAAVLSLARDGIPPDIQELLTIGNASMGVKPWALWRAISAAERVEEMEKLPTIETAALLVLQCTDIISEATARKLAGRIRALSAPLTTQETGKT